MIRGEQREMKVTNEDENPKDTVECLLWFIHQGKAMMVAGGWDQDFRVYEINGENGGEIKLVFCINLGAFVFTIDYCREEESIYVGDSSGCVRMFDLNKKCTSIVAKFDCEIFLLKIVEMENPKATTLCILLQNGELIIKGISSTTSKIERSISLGSWVSCADIQGGTFAICLGGHDLLVTNIFQLCETTTDIRLHINQKYSELSIVGLGLKPDGSGLIVFTESGYFKIHNLKQRDYIQNIGFPPIKLETTKMGALHYNSSSCSSKISLQPTKISINSLINGTKRVHFSAVSSASNEIRLIDFETGKEEVSLIKCSEGDHISTFSFSPDSSMIAYAVGYTWNRGVEGLGQYKGRRPGLFVKKL